MSKKSILILFVLNCVLIAASWSLALYSYPRLPQRMPLWIPFFGLPPMSMIKSPLFFLYPGVQTIFAAAFLICARILSFRGSHHWQRTLSMDSALLSLIFFNLIFIHIQSSLVLLAHHTRNWINNFYFFALFLVILALIPYYRMRAKIIRR